MRGGDTVVVHSMDRLARNLHGIIRQKFDGELEIARKCNKSSSESIPPGSRWVSMIALLYMGKYRH